MSEAFKSQPATISKADVVSNSDTEKNASLVNGIIRLTYFESIKPNYELIEGIEDGPS